MALGALLLEIERVCFKPCLGPNNRRLLLNQPPWGILHRKRVENGPPSAGIEF